MYNGLGSPSGIGEPPCRPKVYCLDATIVSRILCHCTDMDPLSSLLAVCQGSGLYTTSTRSRTRASRAIGNVMMPLFAAKDRVNAKFKEKRNN